MRRYPMLRISVPFVVAAACVIMPGTPAAGQPGRLELAASSPADTSRPAVVTVSGTSGLEDALEDAQPGTVIRLEDGVYRRSGGDRWSAAAHGTVADSITLTGSRRAILESDGPNGDYGLHITGSHWRIEGLTIRNAAKGIVLDASVGTVIVDVEVHTIGDEGVHFRKCSSDGVLRGSYVHDTGVDSPQYGEGVYAGSANSNWHLYGCGAGGVDDTERTLIANNVFRDIPAEGADLKEGTDSGTLRGNTFDNVGFSGENSADSAVDAKGNNWRIAENTVTGASGEFADAFQTHSVYSGYGQRNRFVKNTVVGPVPGFGFGLYPGADNLVKCNNSAPHAAEGLVGDNGHPTACGDQSGRR